MPYLSDASEVCHIIGDTFCISLRKDLNSVKRVNAVKMIMHFLSHRLFANDSNSCRQFKKKAHRETKCH